MARQQLIVDTKTPAACAGSSSPYIVDYVASGGEDWSQKGVDIDGEAANDNSGTSVSLSSDGSIVAIGAYGNDGAGFNAGHVRVYAWSGSAWVQRGADIDGEAANDYSGISVSLSSDGSIVAIGAHLNDGAGNDAGHVRIYAWSGSAWVQRGADIDGEATNDHSGTSVSLSSDGSIVAIGAPYDDGAGNDAGHVRIYAWSGSAWVQRGADIDGEAANDYSGRSVSLSSDGSIVAIGAYLNDGTGTSAGHVRVYAWSGSAWVQRGADIDGEAVNDYSGVSVSLSSDGSIVAIGANFNDGAGNAAGHVRVYAWSGSAWVQRGVDIDGEAANDYSGYSVSLSSDGSIVAIGAYGAYGNNGAASAAGHVRIYAWSGSAWVQRGADIDGEAANDYSGRSVSLNDNGRTVAIGAPYDDGAGNAAGHVRVYETISPISPQVGDWAVAEHKETDTGADLSTYTYRVTHVTDADTLVLEFVSATGGYTDDSPCDLCDGTGPPGDCPIAPHVIKRDLGGMFMMLLD